MKVLFKNNHWRRTLLTVWFTMIFFNSSKSFTEEYSASLNDDSTILYLERSGQSIPFQVEVACTPQALAQGLMNRHYLDQDAGMLFVFPKPQNVKFWMKNTYLALDLIFMDQNFKVVQLYANARPLDLKKIESDQIIKYVLEISAGSIQHHDIRKGDLFKTELNLTNCYKGN